MNENHDPLGKKLLRRTLIFVIPLFFAGLFAAIAWVIMAATTAAGLVEMTSNELITESLMIGGVVYPVITLLFILLFWKKIDPYN